MSYRSGRRRGSVGPVGYLAPAAAAGQARAAAPTSQRGGPGVAQADVATAVAYAGEQPGKPYARGGPAAPGSGYPPRLSGGPDGCSGDLRCPCKPLIDGVPV